MIQKAEFDKLQFGDKLAQITENGELYTYKYIGRDPGWENRYAFLSGEDGSSALHYNRDFILLRLLFRDKEYGRCKEGKILSPMAGRIRMEG